jgi:hypothetical protein
METVVSVDVLRPYVVAVTFDDGHRREVDIAPFLDGEVFRPLRDPAFFAQVTVDPELGTIVWPNGADLAPEFLYHGENTPYGPVVIKRPEAAVGARSDKE